MVGWVCLVNMLIFPFSFVAVGSQDVPVSYVLVESGGRSGNFVSGLAFPLPWSWGLHIMLALNGEGGGIVYYAL